jgi:aspartate carbamoyltransferase
MAGEAEKMPNVDPADERLKMEHEFALEVEREAELDRLEAQFPKIDGDFKNKSIIALSQFTKDDIDIVFEQSEIAFQIEKKNRYIPNLEGRRIARMFFEGSTRTDQSYRFGAGAAGAFIDGFNAAEAEGMSSKKKNESDADTVETFDEYAHLLVMRHKDELFVPQTALITKHPVHNGGNGSWEHPTQALLDGYTIMHRKGRIEGLTVTMHGDLLKGRTVHSLSQLLAMYGAEINLVAPEEVQMPEKVLAKLGNLGIKPRITDDIHEVIEKTDVYYRVRTQKERFRESMTEEQFNAIAKKLEMATPELLEKGPEDLSILHPRPEDADNPDFHPDVRKDLRYDVLFQTHMGLIVRRALLGLTLGKPLLAGV